MQPHATGHAYPNYPDPDLPDWPAASLGTNLAHAIEVKTVYDPDDVFRHAQSVRPRPPTDSPPPPAVGRPHDVPATWRA